MINYDFKFGTINVFDCFCDVMTQFQLEFDNVTRSSVHLSNHTQNEKMHNVSAHQTAMILPIIVGSFHSWNCFGHVIHTLQASMYQNMTKLLTHPSIN